MIRNMEAVQPSAIISKKLSLIWLPIRGTTFILQQYYGRQCIYLTQEYYSEFRRIGMYKYNLVN